jgi:hypothetical protein
MDARIKTVAPIQTTLLFDIIVNLDPRIDMGPGPTGQRVVFGSAGGAFEGPRLRGEVLRGGGDWAIFRPDGVMTLDVRLSLKTDDGALIHMTYGGRMAIPAALKPQWADPAVRRSIDPAEYYFRTNPLFETGSPNHAWLNDIVCVGTGYLVDGGVAYRVFQVT